MLNFMGQELGASLGVVGLSGLRVCHDSRPETRDFISHFGNGQQSRHPRCQRLAAAKHGTGVAGSIRCQSHSLAYT